MPPWSNVMPEHEGSGVSSTSVCLSLAQHRRSWQGPASAAEAVPPVHEAEPSAEAGPSRRQVPLTPLGDMESHCFAHSVYEVSPMITPTMLTYVE